MIHSINFRVRKWEFNKDVAHLDLHTDTLFGHNPLVSKINNKTEGLCFTWTLIITSDHIQVLYYSSEECFVMSGEIMDEELLNTIKLSHSKSLAELAQRNWSAALNFGMHSFERMKDAIDLKKIRLCLEG